MAAAKTAEQPVAAGVERRRPAPVPRPTTPSGSPSRRAAVWPLAPTGRSARSTLAARHVRDPEQHVGHRRETRRHSGRPVGGADAARDSRQLVLLFVLRPAARRRGRRTRRLLARPPRAGAGRTAWRSARASITAERLSDRLPVDNPNDELGRLASVFNDTLGRLESSFEQMRRFTADVSHELRTPLTAIRSVGEVGLRGAPRRDGVSRRSSAACSRRSIGWPASSIGC